MGKPTQAPAVAAAERQPIRPAQMELMLAPKAIIVVDAVAEDGKPVPYLLGGDLDAYHTSIVQAEKAAKEEAERAGVRRVTVIASEVRCVVAGAVESTPRSEGDANPAPQEDEGKEGGEEGEEEE